MYLCASISLSSCTTVACKTDLTWNALFSTVSGPIQVHYDRKSRTIGQISGSPRVRTFDDSWNMLAHKSSQQPGLSNLDNSQQCQHRKRADSMVIVSGHAIGDAPSTLHACTLLPWQRDLYALKWFKALVAWIILEFSRVFLPLIVLQAEFGFPSSGSQPLRSVVLAILSAWPGRLSTPLVDSSYLRKLNLGCCSPIETLTRGFVVQEGLI